MIIFPATPALPPARCGFRTSTPFFIALAATSISGTKISLFLNFSPTTPIALIILSRTSGAAFPSSRASCTAAAISLDFPLTTRSKTSSILLIRFYLLKLICTHLSFFQIQSVFVPDCIFCMFLKSSLTDSAIGQTCLKPIFYFFTGPISPSLYAPIYSIQ